MSWSNENVWGSLHRFGTPGDYVYAYASNRAQTPVLYVSFWDAVRYANWLHNGKPTGPQGPETTEDGAYTLTPEAIENNTVFRNARAKFFIPNQDEWYKAAYYKGGSTDAGYWLYPTQSDIAPRASRPPGTVNSANYNFAVGNSTDVAAYVGTIGPYGTYGQAGNALEWVENVRGTESRSRSLRGGGYYDGAEELAAVTLDGWAPWSGLQTFGFRIATVPEPNAWVLMLLAISACLNSIRTRRPARGLPRQA